TVGEIFCRNRYGFVHTAGSVGTREAFQHHQDCRDSCECGHRLVFGNPLERGEDATLSSERLKLFEEQGFLLVSGLIPRQVVERACHRLIARVRHIDAGSYHEFIRDRFVLACFGRKLCSAAGRLAGAHAAMQPPTAAYAISVLPTATVWEWPAPHIDHAIEKD